MSCVNTTEGQFEVCELNDNELFTELEALIAHISPKECIIPNSETPEFVLLQKMLVRNKILVSKVKKNEFTSEGIDQDLNRLLYFGEGQQRNSKAFPETNLIEAMDCLEATIKYLDLSGNESNFNQFKLSTFDIHRYVRLDSAAISALNLFPIPNKQTSKHTSVLGVLDKCCTPQGHRLLSQWLKQPLRDLNLINERLEIVETLLNDSETRHLLSSNSLTRVPDLLMLAKKLSNKKGSLQDCYRIYQTVSNIPLMINILKKPNNKCIKGMLIDPICDLLSDMEKYQDMIEQVLDMDLVDRSEFLIKASFNEDLEGKK